MFKLWSGYSEGLYSSLTWTMNPCKVSVNGEITEIYDLFDNKVYKYTESGLMKNRVVFHEASIIEKLVWKIYSFGKF